MRSLLIGVLELRRRTVEVPMLGERQAPGVVTGRDAGSEFHGLRIPRLRTRPVAAQTQEVAPESVAVHERELAHGIERRIRLRGLARLLVRQCRKADGIRIGSRDGRVGVRHRIGAPLLGRRFQIPYLFGEQRPILRRRRDVGHALLIDGRGFEPQRRRLDVVHLHINLRDGEIFGACGSACRSDAAVGLHVGNLAHVPCRQVPDYPIVVLVLILRRTPRPSTGRLHHLLTHPHRSFLVAEAREREHDVVVRGPVIGLQAQLLPIEGQRLRHRPLTALAADGIGPVIEHIGPLAWIRRGVGRLSEADRVVVPIIIGQVSRPESGLRLSVDILTGFRQELVQISRPIAEGLGQDPSAAHGERNSAGLGLHQIAIDMLVVAEACFQHPLQLPDRDAGFRDVNRNIVGPGIRERPVLCAAPGRRLNPCQYIKESGGEDLAVQAVRRKGGWGAE